MEIKTIWQPVPTHCEVMAICQGVECRICPHKEPFKSAFRELSGRTNDGTKPKPEMRAWMFEKDV